MLLDDYAFIGLAFNADKSLLAVSTKDSFLHLFDFNLKERLWSTQTEVVYYQLLISDEENMVAALSQDVISIFNLEDGSLLSNPNGATFSPVSNFEAWVNGLLTFKGISIDDSALNIVFPPKPFRKREIQRVPPLFDPRIPIIAVAKPSWDAAAISTPSGIKFFDLRTRTEVWENHTGQAYTQMLFSLNNRCLAAMYSEGISIFDARTGELLPECPKDAVFRPHSNHVKWVVALAAMDATVIDSGWAVAALEISDKAKTPTAAIESGTKCIRVEPQHHGSRSREQQANVQRG